MMTLTLRSFSSLLSSIYVMQGKQLTDLSEWMVRVTVDFMAEGMFKSDYHTIRSQSKAEGQLVGI